MHRNGRPHGFHGDRWKQKLRDEVCWVKANGMEAGFGERTKGLNSSTIALFGRLKPVLAAPCGIGNVALQNAV